MATSVIAEPPTETAVASESFAARKLLGGATALIAATGIERGCGFLANLLAARIGGVSIFGAYSLAMTTANNIAAYAGAGIGSTATRFSGQYPEGSAGYRSLTRALALVSAVSAALAAVLLWAGAGPLARVLLHQPDVINLLRWASLSAGVMILFECCRGFLVGQHRLGSLVLFSGVMGSGMIVALPLASRLGPVPMLLAQAAIAGAAMCAVLLLGRRHRPLARDGESIGAIARRVWSFGLVQLLGIVGLNAAGWWVASLVARSDASLVEMGLFAVANQVRNMAALAPGLLTQSSYGLLANEEANPRRVLLFCTWLATLAVLLAGGGAIVVLPWVLPLLWGKAYAAGIAAGSLGLATAIVHMAASPAAARLTVVSLPISGWINGLWSALVVMGSFVLLSSASNGRSSAVAMAIYLAAHTVSAALVLWALARKRAMPNGMLPLFGIAAGAALLLGALTLSPVALRPAYEALVVAAGLIGTVLIGRRHGFTLASAMAPAREMVRRWR